jgi:thioredoxin 1
MSTTADDLVHATSDTFDRDVLASDKPVLVDFWAAWCPPCRLIKPELEALAPELADRARIVLVDVDDQPELASRFDVTSIPALRVFHRGAIVAKASGFHRRAELHELLRPYL